LEGLKVPQKQPKRGRLWLTDGSCVRLRPTHRNHVWSWDFVMDRTDDGRAIKMLTLIDEYTKESLVIYPRRRIRSHDVIDIFADVMIERGLPEFIRSDTGPEMVTKKLRRCSLESVPRRFTSRRAVRGRMAIAKASMACCATSS
jgi:putative transposase